MNYCPVISSEEAIADYDGDVDETWPFADDGE
jgi:hypothetical protein